MQRQTTTRSNKNNYMKKTQNTHTQIHIFFLNYIRTKQRKSFKMRKYNFRVEKENRKIQSTMTRKVEQMCFKVFIVFFF
jgi:hypothetical protein